MIMLPKTENQLVFTVKDRCRVCYTCVRECPVKAIKIINGQAEVINTRCIGCGNCVRVCSQEAKYYAHCEDEVMELLKTGAPCVACVAPSFPAEFDDISDYRKFVGMLRALGFTYVVEVAVGADLTAARYKELIEDEKALHFISADCPAVVYYIRHYHPNLVPYLAPIASPMVATARVMKHLHGEDLKTVFIGPCVAKKAESNELDLVITYRELREVFSRMQLHPEKVQPSEFDRPLGGKGCSYAISRGKLYTMDHNDDVVSSKIMVASGRENFREAIREFEEGMKNLQDVEVLCCDGCVMGAGMTYGGNLYNKTAAVRNYISAKMQDFDEETWVKDTANCMDAVDLSQEFTPSDRRIPLPSRDNIEKVLIDMGKAGPKDHLNCGACGYNTCIDHAVAIVEGLAESEMCLPYTIEKLHKSIDELNISNEKLASAQQSLRHSEKLANMGQLSAGIAHELNNPLGVITMYSNILKEECVPDSQMSKDLDLIVEQADRCKKIVGGLLNFARKNQVRYTDVDVAAFTRHSLDQIIIPDNVAISFESKLKDPVAQLDTDQMSQVLTNIEKNAFEAMPEGGTLHIELDGDDDKIHFIFKDTGSGIADEHMDKIFTPFFTTKQAGKGTGLGLPLIYGIIKMHRGQINIDSQANPAKGPTGTTFIITIPRKATT
jgi:iron only hydrogenase large subunit-like protein/nitrogen-specific signal transduction histidine kinase